MDERSTDGKATNPRWVARASDDAPLAQLTEADMLRFFEYIGRKSLKLPIVKEYR